MPEIADVSSDQQVSGLSANVIIDRDTASRLGLTAQAIDSALYDAFGQRQVSVMYKSINQYHVVLALQQQWWQSPDFLNTIYVQTPRGTNVPLSTFAHFDQGVTLISVPHQGQFPATTISFDLAEGAQLSDAVAAINRAEQEMGLPATITGKFERLAPRRSIRFGIPGITDDADATPRVIFRRLRVELHHRAEPDSGKRPLQPLQTGSTRIQQ